MGFRNDSPYSRNDISWITLAALSLVILAFGLIFLMKSRPPDASYTATRAAQFATQTPTPRPTHTPTPYHTATPTPTLTPTATPDALWDRSIEIPAYSPWLDAPLLLQTETILYTAAENIQVLDQPGGESLFSPYLEYTPLFLTGKPSQWYAGEEWVEVREILGKTGWARRGDLTEHIPDLDPQPDCDAGDILQMARTLSSLAVGGRMTYLPGEDRGQLVGYGISDGQTRYVRLKDGTEVLTFHAYLVNPGDSYPPVWIAASWTTPDGAYYSLLPPVEDAEDQRLEHWKQLSAPRLIRLASPAANFVYPQGFAWGSCSPSEAGGGDFGQAYCALGQATFSAGRGADVLLMASLPIDPELFLFGFNLFPYAPPPLPAAFSACAPAE